MNVPTIDIQQTGANIKALRKAAGIKVKDVADTLGVSTQAVAKWQAGTALPTIANLVIHAAMLDTKIDDILVIAYTLAAGLRLYGRIDELVKSQAFHA